jgi:endonuclease YncB( thermonuclease family)
MPRFLAILAPAATLAVLLHLSPSGEAAAPGDLRGAVRVVDGDTLDLEGQRVRLEGIDAPEIPQSCPSSVGTWDCGKAAARALKDLVAGQQVACRNRGTDKYGRMLGVCFVADRDINAEMVRQGHAWAFVKYSKSYVEEEAHARAARIGIWQGQAEPAWVYREKRWAGAQAAAPSGCAIKGNVSERGHIYHTPWSPWYDKVRIDQRRGERWFCSEAEALAAGWRPAAVH